MPTELRIATADDIDLLTALNVEVHELHAQMYPSIFKPAERTAIRAEFERTIRRTDFVHWIAYDGNEPTGYLVMEVQRFQEDAFRYGGSRGYVHQMGVRAEYRRKGIGSALLQAAEAEAKDRRCTQFVLDYYGGNAVAAEFYRAGGFEILQTRAIRRL